MYKQTNEPNQRSKVHTVTKVNETKAYSDMLLEHLRHNFKPKNKIKSIFTQLLVRSN